MVFQQDIVLCHSSKLVKKFFCIKQSVTFELARDFTFFRIFGLFAKDGRDNCTPKDNMVVL